jgi:hypothetical protein
MAAAVTPPLAWQLRIGYHAMMVEDGGLDSMFTPGHGPAKPCFLTGGPDEKNDRGHNLRSSDERQ